MAMVSSSGGCGGAACASGLTWVSGLFGGGRASDGVGSPLLPFACDGEGYFAGVVFKLAHSASTSTVAPSELARGFFSCSLDVQEDQTAVNHRSFSLSPPLAQTELTLLVLACDLSHACRLRSPQYPPLLHGHPCPSCIASSYLP